MTCLLIELEKLNTISLGSTAAVSSLLSIYFITRRSFSVNRLWFKMSVICILFFGIFLLLIIGSRVPMIAFIAALGFLFASETRRSLLKILFSSMVVLTSILLSHQYFLSAVDIIIF